MAPKNIDKGLLIKYLTGSSTTSGGDFGEINNIPTSNNNQNKMYMDCDNENCNGNKILFQYDVDIINGDCRHKRDSYHVEGDLSSKFKLHGYYCPICENSRIKIDNEIIYEGSVKI